MSLVHSDDTHVPRASTLQAHSLVKKNWENMSEDVEHFGVCIGSDGWSDINRRSLLGFMAMVTQGSYYWGSIDTSGESKTGLFIGQRFIEIIEELGAKNVVALVTDG